MGTGVKLGLLAVAVGAAVVLLVVLRPADEDEEAQPTSPATTTTGTTAPTTEAEEVVRAEIVVRGEEVSGPDRVELERGQRLVLVVRSDVVDHVHVHGYDLLRDVGPGQPAQFAFRARATGRFEVELEERSLPLTVLVVTA